MQNETFYILFVAMLGILVCVEILYVSLNIMHLIMKSITNNQLLGEKLSICKAFHDQMHHF